MDSHSNAAVVPARNCPGNQFHFPSPCLQHTFVADHHLLHTVQAQDQLAQHNVCECVYSLFHVQVHIVCRHMRVTIAVALNQFNFLIIQHVPTVGCLIF